MVVTQFTFRTYLAHLVDTLRWAGTSVLDEMEKAGEVSHEDRRALQYDFCAGISDAHHVMSDPKVALECHERRHHDGAVRANMEGGLRLAVEEWLEYVLGKAWRTVEISAVPMPPSSAWLREHLVAIRAAMTAKPSEVGKLLPVRDIPKCSRCHQPGHMAFDCPFNTSGVTTGRQVSNAGGSTQGPG